MANTREARVAEQIQQIVARMITTKIKDPRLGMVTVTDTRVSGDLQHATVYYTVLGSEQDAIRTARALESAKGLIRSAVGKGVGLRLTPTIEFERDSVPEQSRSIENALVAARAHDAYVRRIAEGAVFAGEADPYKKPRDIEASDTDGYDG
ncbi:MAG: 30S ribosome-binding factor RbfA [Actinomycetaceae bacterium]|nr:30S ribosome-binding factor RbfA [Actinomycetaceae bacterium]MDY5855176.1 30S ribosome-binding factor RbfA [Arcanobacterium sp.]